LRTSLAGQQHAGGDGGRNYSRYRRTFHAE
jgi:hypothetical protein